MPKIFLCYRREDSKWPAQRIYNNLADHFGPESVVFDIDTIPLGADFREYLNKEVSKCDILLAVIGDQWLEILKQRLDQPNDFVRIEIQAALKKGDSGSADPCWQEIGAKRKRTSTGISEAIV